MTEAFSTFDLLQWMDAETRAAFKAAARVRKYRSGQIIYMQGDTGAEMYRLLSGSVNFTVNRPDGRELVFALFQPGDCFGDSSLVDDDVRPQTVEALTDLEVEVVGRADFNRLRAAHRSFDDALLRSVTRQLRLVCAFYEDANMNPLSVRVAGRIVSAALSFGAQHSDGLRLTIPLSQTELAAMAGASRQSVNKVLQAFQAEALLRVEYGGLLILDLEGLKARMTLPD
ncbi:Crp/Fnr family transcriptional regulator [Stakelama tenebrarum]|uniref:Crp/Fnr family transcriptional regulator n=1 Tax=Stakelama tenebrarum TaxID=2711215 RepID=A0A6G6Y3A5_9SPHN|nr:Crp/Fnr family transcriptional regulator [Sphingosinithalassobacter tenebrarum]QIG79380.1 Crp/Fnr family transcriptional regulator [Sphingosinithalassobacter tenebrarum]